MDLLWEGTKGIYIFARLMMSVEAKQEKRKKKEGNKKILIDEGGNVRDHGD